MTTTKSALAAGATRFVRIMLVEGVDRAFTEGTESDAQSALVGTDWDGQPTYQCAFSVVNRQSADPWEPCQPGGSATVTVFDDEFGVLAHRTAGGAETTLTATLDRTEATIEVLDTSTFPSSGYIHIGTECIAYDNIASSTQFGTATRGMFSPFGATPTEGTVRFTHDHRVEPVPYAPNLQPRVTQYPREWEGRWVGVWLHAFDENGINSKSDALCIFAGRLVEVHDEESGNTTLVIEHVLTDMRDASVGRDQVTATVADGVWLVDGMRFDMFDVNTVRKDANSLIVRDSPSGANEIPSGNYELGDLFEVLNQWWASETTAGRLHGSYTINTAHANGELRVKIYWQIPGTVDVKFQLRMPTLVAAFLGFNDGASDTLGYSNIEPGFNDPDEIHHYYQNWVPLRNIIAPGSSLNVNNPYEEINVHLQEVSGIFQDQYASLPVSMRPHDPFGKGWGVFLIGDQILAMAAFVDNGDGSYDLLGINPLGTWYSTVSESNKAALQTLSKRLDDPTPISVRQVFMFEMSRAEFLKSLLFSTGTAGFNHATFDSLPYGCALGYPGELLLLLASTVDNMPGADKAIGVIIDKPTKISDLIGSDLLLCHIFFVWQSGSLQMRTWQTPSAGLAVTSLTEENKAEPASNRISQRSTTVLSDQWSRKIIKIRYNRTLVANGDDYKSAWPPIEDRTAIDNSGDRGEVFTINARNTYTEFAGNGAGIEDIVPNVFIPPLTLFTRAARTLRRSIAVTEYEALVPGDIVIVSDEFARDPTTGRRRIVNRPATVVSVATDYGGKQADGSVAPMVGEVTLYLIDLNRIYQYAPSAKLDSYDPDTKTITLADHEYSESSETADPGYFGAGYAIRITEIDPADPSSALTWARVIDSKSGNDIVHDGAALASFDAGKEYRVTFGAYSDAISLQQDKAFQADDNDGLIEDIIGADMFGVAVSSIAATSSSHEDLGELHADIDIGEGKAYDVGSLKGFTRLIDNLIDHKTAIQNPTLGPLMENADYSGGLGWKLVSIEPIYLTGGITTNSVLRFLRMAPMIRSSDGSEVSVRVTLARGYPTSDSINDVIRDIPYSDATFTTSSTSWVIPDAPVFQVAVKGATNYAWILIECSHKAQTLGIAHCHETERIAS